jgi:hypothetical protein
MVCVLEAAQQQGIPFRAITLKSINNEGHLFGVTRDAMIEDRAKPDFSDETKQIVGASDGPVYSFVSGIQHVHLGLRPVYYPAEPPFDFVLPETADLPLEEGAEIVPVDAVRQVVQESFSSRMKILRRLSRMAPGRVIQFAPPPPAPDRWIEVLMRKRQFDTPPRLPSGRVRWKLWRLTTDIFREHACGEGARFVDYPAASVDADGFMRAELVRNLTHGNVGFGELVLDQIRGLK